MFVVRALQQDVDSCQRLDSALERARVPYVSLPVVLVSVYLLLPSHADR